MNDARLRPCPSCARHARVSEDSCPFCGARFGASFRARPNLQAPTGRLTRAALLALSSGAASLGPACSSSSSSSSNKVTVFPPYGLAPFPEDAGPDAEVLLGAAYGLAAFEDGEVEPNVSACVAAGGQCVDDAGCAFSIHESCGAAGGACCVPCEADPDVKAISASNYDRSCTADSDCVAVGVGDPCRPCDILCPGNAAINKSSLARYSADVASSPAGMDGAACSCQPITLSVCCNAGTCDPSCAGDAGSGD